MCRLFSLVGRVNREGLLKPVRSLVPVLPVPTFGLLPRVSFPEAASPDFLVLIELSMREVLLRLIRLLGLLAAALGGVEPDGLLVLTELPMPEVLLRLIRLLGLLVDGPLALIELPMREVLLWLIWLRVLAVGGLPELEREAAKLLALKELPEDLRALEEFEGRETVERLDELLRVTLELLLVEGLEVLTLELEDLEKLNRLTRKQNGMPGR